MTGGASGLGKGTVEYFTKLGSKVVFCDLATSNGQKVADELGDTVTYVPADVRNESDVQNVLSEIERKHGRLDALINCAGQCRAHSIFNFIENRPSNQHLFDLVMSVSESLSDSNIQQQLPFFTHSFFRCFSSITLSEHSIPYDWLLN